MRLVWLIGAPASAKTSLEQALARERTGVDFLVRTASNVQEIPDKHFANPGTIALVDSFSVHHKGFEGAKVLRDRGFKGHIFLFGEPAPEEISQALISYGLAGFFPTFERADWFFVGGVISATTDYTGSIEVNRFITPGGRCSFETIRNLKDFNSFSAKLAAFVGRFGVDLPKLKKVLMALSLPHVKTDSGSPAIEQPFAIHYGMDPHKIVLAANTFSRGAAVDVVRRNYASAVSSIRNETPITGAMFPEFIHLTKATQNLILVGGSAAGGEAGALDPLYMITTVTFPPKDASTVVVPYFFSFVHVVPSAEIVEGEEEPSAPEEVPPVEAESPIQDAPPEGSLMPSSELDELLAEPKLVGDAPLIVGDPTDLVPQDILGEESITGDLESSTNGEEGQVGILVTMPSSGLGSTELQRKLDQALAECENLRKTCDAMGADIKRLMKERRQPTTDKELRDATLRLQEQVKLLNVEKMKALEMVGSRDKQIELMKVQIETLKKEKAA